MLLFAIGTKLGVRRVLGWGGFFRGHGCNRLNN